MFVTYLIALHVVRPAAGRPVARRQHSGSEEEEVESSEQPSLDAAPQGAEPAESDTLGSDEGEDEDEDDSSDEDEDARPSQRHARMRQLYADSSEEGSEGGEGDPDEGSRGRGRLGFARSLDDISDPDEEESEDVARGEEESEDAGPSISASDVIQ